MKNSTKVSNEEKEKTHDLKELNIISTNHKLVEYYNVCVWFKIVGFLINTNLICHNKTLI